MQITMKPPIISRFGLAVLAGVSLVTPALAVVVPHAVGFRVASVPEPTSGVLAMVASGMLLIRRKR